MISLMAQTDRYLAIARRFRPQTFKAIVGQEAIVTTLKNALRFKRLSHAYLFCGSRGTGKTTLARLLAKALNCHQLTEDFEPCNQCPSCQEMNAGRSLDVLEIDGASNRGIDDIREINETVGYSPASGKYKIYIIDEVHMLTKEAFNALLKTLEEPPPQIKFFFATTEPHKLPATIASRCQRFELKRISDSACIAKLTAIAKEMKIEIQEEALYLIIQRAEGSLRDAESLLDQLSCYAEGAITADAVTAHLGLTPKATLFALDRAIRAENLSAAFSFTDELYNAGRDLGSFVDALIDHFRLLLLIKLKQPLPLLSEAERKEYAASAAHYTAAQCLYILDLLKQEWQNFSKTPLKRVTLEMILLELIRSRKHVPLESVVERLLQLEQSASGTEELPPVADVVETTPEPAPLAPVAATTEAVPEPLIQTPAPAVEPALEPIESLISAPAPEPALEPAPSPLPFDKEMRTVEQERDELKRRAKLENLLRFAAIELEGKLTR